MGFDVFYPYLPIKDKIGSRHNDLELRYSLRSIEKNLSGFDRVFIAGETVPDWLTNVVHLPIKDDPKRVPDWNIMNKVSNADGISENFLFINDDHFIMKPYQVETFPNYYHSTLDIYCRRRGRDGYGYRAINTKNWLVEQGLKLLHFDIHYPIIYNLKAFREVMDKVPWDKEKHGFIVKSLYGNYMKLPGTYTYDNKTSKIDPRLPVFSTYPHMTISLMNYLKAILPKPSRFEKTT